MGCCCRKACGISYRPASHHLEAGSKSFLIPITVGESAIVFEHDRDRCLPSIGEEETGFPFGSMMMIELYCSFDRRALCLSYPSARPDCRALISSAAICLEV